MFKFKIFRNIILIILVLIAIFAARSCFFSGNTQSHAGEFQMHVINVASADSIFIISPDGKSMLVDAGESSDFSVIDKYISQYVSKLDVLVATHPHSDHIGGMQDVFEKYNPDKIYMSPMGHTTDMYQNLLSTIDKAGKKVIAAKSGTSIPLGSLTFEVLSPAQDSYDEMNNASVVLHLIYKDTSFLLCGDAEKVAENEILKNYKLQLKSDVIKIGHHGSNTSSSEEFLKAVNPKYALISTRQDDATPSELVLSRLRELNIVTYRTDKNGTISVYSDGSSITVNSEK